MTRKIRRALIGGSLLHARRSAGGLAALAASAGDGAIRPMLPSDFAAKGGTPIIYNRSAQNRRCALRISALALAGLLVSSRLMAQAPQQPVFRGGVEVIEVDVNVVDDRGRPVADLRGPEFTVSV